MIAQLEKQFGNLDLKYAIGGQISFDVFPRGWDKTYCLQFLQDFDEVHFFGDKTSPVWPPTSYVIIADSLVKGGNDYEIYSDPRVIGHSVTSPEHTEQIVTELFLK